MGAVAVKNEIYETIIQGTAAGIEERIDIVDIFRRSEEVPAIVNDAIKAGARAIWMQLGVINAPAAAAVGRNLARRGAREAGGTRRNRGVPLPNRRGHHHHRGLERSRLQGITRRAHLPRFALASADFPGR